MLAPWNGRKDQFARRFWVGHTPQKCRLGTCECVGMFHLGLLITFSLPSFIPKSPGHLIDNIIVVRRRFVVHAPAAIYKF